MFVDNLEKSARSLRKKGHQHMSSKGTNSRKGAEFSIEREKRFKYSALGA